MKRQSAGRALAIAVLSLLVLAALCAGWLVPDASSAGLEREPPPGQGLWTWWLLATRSAVLVVGSATCGGLLLGTAIGAAAVYGGSGPALVLSRLVEFIGAVPGLILVGILRVADPSGGSWSLVGALALLRTLEVAQLTRVQVLTLSSSDFVAAARALGASRRWQLREHILPRLVQPLAVNSLLGAAALIGLEAASNFVGLGLPNHIPSWGGALALLAKGGDTTAGGLAALSIGAASAALYGLGISLSALPAATFAARPAWAPWRRRAATLNEPR